jgi:hypothetical protein
MYSKICKKCNREFETEIKNKQICDSCLTGVGSIFRCKTCGKPIPAGKKFCSHSCNSKNNVNNYNPFSDDIIKKKIADTKQNLLANPDYKEQIKRKTELTKLERYGDKHYNNIQKIKKTNLEKYGVEYNFASKDVKLNGKATLKENLNDTDYKNNIVNKRKATCLNRFGLDNIFKDSDYIKQCKINKHGSLDESYRIGLEASKATCLERYGVEYYTQSDLYKSAAETKRLEKINNTGLVTKSQEALSEDFKALLYNRNLSIEFLNTIGKLSIYELSNMFNCSITTIVHWINRLDLRDYIQFNTGSKYEIDLQNTFNNLSFIKHARVLNGKEIDLYDSNNKLGLEFNGNYWHSDLNKSKNYHFDKSKLAESLGIRLIHIYEYEWLDSRIRPILESIINISTGNVSNKIYARNCIIKQISNLEAKPFNDKNHLQGHRNAQITYGLFYNNELVQLMSFSFDKRNNWWEIIRGCPGSNNIVVGGVSKLFKHFIKNHNPQRIFSYCDFNKFDGKGYEAIGMRFIGYTGPDLTWLVDGKAIKRQPKKHNQLKEVAEAKIWGAGSKKYLWENNLK